MWYAPSLNFTPLDSVTIDQGMETDIQVTSIEAGVEPGGKAKSNRAKAASAHPSRPDHGAEGGCSEGGAGGGDNLASN